MVTIMGGSIRDRSEITTWFLGGGGGDTQILPIFQGGMHPDLAIIKNTKIS